MTERVYLPGLLADFCEFEEQIAPLIDSKKYFVIQQPLSSPVEDLVFSVVHNPATDLDLEYELIQVTMMTAGTAEDGDKRTPHQFKRLRAIPPLRASPQDQRGNMRADARVS